MPGKKRATQPPAAGADAKNSVVLPPGLEAPPGLPWPTKATTEEPKVLADDESAAAAPTGQGQTPISLPPGLSPPPGLEDEAQQLVKPMYQVCVSGLPNKILTDPMMEAVLQQAGLEDDVISFSVKTGRPCGEVTLDFASYEAAAQCAAHFQGCQWDRSGEEVAAEVVPLESAAAAEDAAAAAAAALFDPAMWTFPQEAFDLLPAPMWSEEESDPDGIARSSLSAAAPAFVPFAAEELPTTSSALSAKAPAFLPAAEAAGAPALERAGRAAGRKATGGSERKPGIGSESSTEVGDSEAEEEEASPKVTAAV